MSRRSFKIWTFKIYKLSLIGGLCLLFLSCSEDNSANKANTNSANGIDVDALRIEVEALKKQVQSLNNEVKTMNGKIAKMAPAKPKTVIPKSIPLNDQYAMGNEKAEVMVIEYTDFQCGFCGRHMKNVLPQIKKNYVDSGKIRYSVRDYPLNFHKQAKIAAVAANCAGDQDKYWEMHEILFKNPRALNKPFFKTQAQKLELDMTAYETCLNDEKNIKKINASLASGNKYGVTGTPKFFVGKVKGNSLVDIKVISGAKNYAAFATAINAKL